jgi:hypothetical protein
MYRSSAQFRRTPAERADQMLSWNRDDVRFFAAGACHILETGLSAFCREHNHRDRPYYAFDPWERALRYIAQFPAPEEHRATLTS